MVDFGRLVAGGLTLGASEAFRPKGGWGSAITGKVDNKITAPTIDPNAFKMPGALGSQSELDARLGAVDSRMSPTMQAAQLGPMAQANAGDLSGYSQAQQQQSQLAQMLMGQAQGTGGPSVAEQQLQRGLQQNIAGQMALAGSMPGGGNPALMQRGLQSNLAGANLDTNYQTGLLRAQEQMQARGLLGSVLGQQGQLGLGAAELGQQGNQFNVGQTNTGALQQGMFNQGAAANNLQAGLQSQAMQDAMAQYILSQQQGINRANMAGGMDMQRLLAGQDLQAQLANAEIARGNAGALGKLLGPAIGGAAAVGTKAVLA